MGKTDIQPLAVIDHVWGGTEEMGFKVVAVATLALFVSFYFKRVYILLHNFFGGLHRDKSVDTSKPHCFW